MTAIGTIKVSGSAQATPVEVETNTLAARFVMRPDDFGLLGVYSIGAAINLLSTENALATPSSRIIFAFRYTQSGALAVIKKVIFSYAQYGTPTAKQHTFNLVRATEFIAQDIGQG